MNEEIMEIQIDVIETESLPEDLLEESLPAEELPEEVLLVEDLLEVDLLEEDLEVEALSEVPSYDDTLLLDQLEKVNFSLTVLITLALLILVKSLLKSYRRY